ncbi:MAG: hypothetical protein MJ087_05845 [Lachnospiraceae bacterium]|nr:hypothetical protein [Lachnospiraceae bacterium]
MIDIHAHILPGIDDGAYNMDMALDMADIAVSGGTSIIVATPHADLDNARARFKNYYGRRFIMNLQAFRKALDEEGIPLTVLSGQEISLKRSTLSKINNEDLISLNHSDYYLVEFEFDEDPAVMEVRLMELLHEGCIPIIAHPERYYAMQDDPRWLYNWSHAGCLVQINRGSVLGRFGEECKSVSDYLLEHNLVTCIASDAHSSRQRSTYMGDVSDYLEDEYSYDFAKRLLYDNPKKIIENKPIAFKGLK